MDRHNRKIFNNKNTMIDNYEKRREIEKKAFKKAVDEHHASMAKGFNAIEPDNSHFGCEVGEINTKKPRLYFPNFELKVEDIPTAKGWEVGEKYRLELVVEMTAMESRVGQEPRVRFDVLGVKPAGEVESKKDKKA